MQNPREESLKILGFSPGQNPDETDIKKAFKKLSVQYHPDKNPNDPVSEQKFKEINAAYQQLTNPEPEQSFSDSGPGFYADPFEFFKRAGFSSNFRVEIDGKENFTPIPVITLHEKLSFKESVLGCERTLNYSKYVPCDSCNGEGSKRTSNQCKTCEGKGVASQRKGNMFIRQSCPKCFGHGIQTVKCDGCNGEKRKLKEVSQKINIPGGARNGARLRLNGAGHYEPFFQTMQNAILEIEVEPHPTLTFDGRDVHFTLNLSLLDALRGVPDQKIDTIYGQSERSIVVPALSKNLDAISVPDLGVSKQGPFEIKNGNEIVHINVVYPDNVSDIISLLEKSQNSSEPKEECLTL